MWAGGGAKAIDRPVETGQIVVGQLCASTEVSPWAFAWRTLIAAELVFGVSSGKGGLGWLHLREQEPAQHSGSIRWLLTIILIGLAVENVVFRFIETRTVRRSGMQS